MNHNILLPSITPREFLLIAKRRMWGMVLISTLVLSATVLIALLAPSIYRAYATIIIEEQHIPSDFVMTTVSTFADQRVENIKQRVLSYTQLSEIITEYNLYPELKQKLTLEEIVDKMRKDVRIEMMSPQIADKNSGRSTVGSSSFTLSYEAENPQAVLRVTDTLTTLFLQQNLEVRQQQIKETSTFLADEATRIEKELDVVEREVAAFKKQHINELPELFQVNIESLSFVERNIERLTSELHSLKEQEAYLETQLVGMTPYQETVQEHDKNIEMLRELKLQLSRLRKKYTDEYPDIAALKDHIAGLEEQVYMDQEVPGAIATTDADHPVQVIPASLLNNPAYVALQAQLRNTQAEIVAIERQIIRFTEQAADYRKRIEATPGVEESYQSMVNHRDALRTKYNDLLHKHQEARVAQELEKEQKGERFTLIEPARLPLKPFKPNRLGIVVAGFALAVGASIGYAALGEFADQTVKNSETLAALTGVPVLAAIPRIITPRERSRKRRRLLVSGAALILLICIAVAIFHFFVMDLDIFWSKVCRRLDSL